MGVAEFFRKWCDRPPVSSWLGSLQLARAFRHFWIRCDPALRAIRSSWVISRSRSLSTRAVSGAVGAIASRLSALFAEDFADDVVTQAGALGWVSGILVGVHEAAEMTLVGFASFSIN